MTLFRLLSLFFPRLFGLLIEILFRIVCHEMLLNAPCDAIAVLCSASLVAEMTSSVVRGFKLGGSKCL